MALLEAEVLTPWVEAMDDGEVSRQALVSIDYPCLCIDITAQEARQIIPTPNLLSVYVRAEDGVMAQIRSDSRFFVVWEQPVTTSLAESLRSLA